MPTWANPRKQIAIRIACWPPWVSLPQSHTCGCPVPTALASRRVSLRLLRRPKTGPSFDFPPSAHTRPVAPEAGMCRSIRWAASEKAAPQAPRPRAALWGALCHKRRTVVCHRRDPPRRAKDSGKPPPPIHTPGPTFPRPEPRPPSRQATVPALPRHRPLQRVVPPFDSPTTPFFAAHSFRLLTMTSITASGARMSSPYAAARQASLCFISGARLPAPAMLRFGICANAGAPWTDRARSPETGAVFTCYARLTGRLLRKFTSTATALASAFLALHD